MKFIQSVIRSLFVVLCIAFALLDYARRGLGSPKTRRSDQIRWLHDWCRRVSPFITLRATIEGTPPRSGLVISNHLGYLDVITLSSISSCLFIAKKEIRDWPIFGALARNGGTIFVNREKANELRPTLEEVQSALREGIPVVLFAEGTSSGGEGVLPFRSPLLQAAVAAQCTVTACSIDYELSQGSVADEVCYWRDMTLVPHLWNLLSKGTIRARVRFGSPRPAGSDRKSLAPQLRARVLELRGLKDSSTVLSTTQAQPTTNGR